MITLKLATTLDGRIATASGESQWITGAPARRAGHMLRGTHDATMVGVGTVLADDPALTCRVPGVRGRAEVRVVLDSHLRTGLSSQLVRTARATPTWILHRPEADAGRRGALAAAGVTLMPVVAGERGIELGAALVALGGAGLTRVLVEGGAQVAGGLLRAGVVDRLAWFHAPGIMGGDGWPAAQAFELEGLAGMPRFRRTAIRLLGEDVLTEFDAVPGGA